MNGRKNKQGYFDSLIGEKTPSKTAGLTYTVAVCVFFLISIVVSFCSVGIGEGKPQWYLYVSFLAAPVVFLMTAIWYFSYTKTPIKSFVKEQNCSPKYYLISILLQVGLLALGEVNTLFLQFLEGFGYENTEIILPNTQGFGMVGVLVAVAVAPALMEELFFRGIFQRELKEFSLWAQVLLCGGLFALYHQNPAQTVYQFICGASFALVAAKAGSFLPTVLSHFINNALVIVLYSLGINSFEGGMYAIMLVFSIVCLIGTLGYLIVFDRQTKQKKQTKKGAYKELFACAFLGVFVFGLSWLITLLTGF